ncbi:MAG: hypothetical protein AAF677_12140, partial [Pseudomonadota bacterium]
MRFFRGLVLGALALATAACGVTPGERAVTGGAFGALAGAAIADNRPGVGALIGGLAGATLGAATAPVGVVVDQPAFSSVVYDDVFYDEIFFDDGFSGVGYYGLVPGTSAPVFFGPTISFTGVFIDGFGRRAVRRKPYVPPRFRGVRRV